VLLTLGSSENERKMEWLRGERSWKTEYLLRTLWEDKLVNFGRESFLWWKMMPRMISEDNLRMTGQEGLSFLAGSENALTTMRWGGKAESGADVSPLAMADSRQGCITSLKGQ
jgi:hypothetical protein